MRSADMSPSKRASGFCLIFSFLQRANTELNQKNRELDVTKQGSPPPPARQLMRTLGCTSALIRSASHSSAARPGPCSESWWRR